MTKLESADLIIKQDGSCSGVYCGDCFLNDRENEMCLGKNNRDNKVKLAIKYKKEHENE